MARQCHPAASHTATGSSLFRASCDCEDSLRPDATVLESRLVLPRYVAGVFEGALRAGRRCLGNMWHMRAGACVHAYIQTHTHTHTHTHTLVCIDLYSMCVCVCACMYVCTYVMSCYVYCMYVCMYVRRQVCLYVFIHT